MAHSRNTSNYIIFTPQFGNHINKQYLFEESKLRWVSLKAYARDRKEDFKDSRFFCVTGLDETDKWKFGIYQDEISSALLPIPELIYDILKDKVYIFKGQLWEIK